MEKLLENLGVLVLLIGSLLTAEGIWIKRIDKSIEKTKRYYEAYDKLLKELNKRIKQEIPKVKKKHPRLGRLWDMYGSNKYSRQLFTNIWGMIIWKKTKHFAHLRAKLFLRKHLLHIGIILIIVGTGIQFYVINYN